MSTRAPRLEELPGTAAYLASLPAGIHSYPECQLKATYARAVQQSLPEGIDGQRFPEELQPLLYHSPSDGDHVSEVHMVALMHAVRDLCFDSDDSLFAWASEGMYRMLDQSSFRMFAAASPPERFPRSASWVWKTLRTGSELELLADERGYARGRIRFPEGMFDRFYTGVIAAGLTVPYLMSSAIEPRATVCDWSPRSFDVEVRWGTTHTP